MAPEVGTFFLDLETCLAQQQTTAERPDSQTVTHRWLPVLASLSVCIILGLLCHPLRVPVSQDCHLELY